MARVVMLNEAKHLAPQYRALRPPLDPATLAAVIAASQTEMLPEDSGAQRLGCLDVARRL